MNAIPTLRTVPTLKNTVSNNNITPSSLALQQNKVEQRVMEIILPRIFKKDHIKQIQHKQEAFQGIPLGRLIGKMAPTKVRDINEKMTEANDFDIKIGQFLVFYGFITIKQLSEALHIKKIYNKGGNKISLGALLIEMNLINQKQLAFTVRDLGIFQLGEYLQLIGAVSEDQVNLALEKCKQSEGIQLGEMLTNQNVLSQEELYKHLKDLKIIKTGEYFVTEGKINHDQLEKVLAEYKRRKANGEQLFVSDILYEGGYVRNKADMIKYFEDAGIALPTKYMELDYN